MGVEREEVTVRQEAHEISGRAVLWSGALMLAVFAVAVALMAWMLSAWRGSDTRLPRADGVRYPAPIEQTRIEKVARGQLLRAAALRELDGWRWVEENRVASIPVQRAMEELVRKADAGVLVWPPSKRLSEVKLEEERATPGGRP